MLRVCLIILLSCNVIAMTAHARSKADNKFLMLYPYKTTLSKQDITRIVGSPLPKPGVQELINARKTNKADHVNFFTENHFSSPSIDVMAVLPCAPTPILAEEITVDKYQNISSNNLRRAAGSPDVAMGHIIYIKGFLRDVDCHPISNTNITIWQSNAYGVYNNDAKHTSKYDPYLQNAGFTITGTDGSFEFISILPGSINDQAPFINFRISIPGERAFETQIFFPDHQLNNSDIRLKKLPEAIRNLLISDIAPVNQDELEEGFYMVIDLIANVINPY